MNIPYFQDTRMLFLIGLLQVSAFFLLVCPLSTEESAKEPRIVRSGDQFELVLTTALRNVLSAYDPNWKMLNESRYSEYDLKGYKKSERQLPYAVIGDFDGNGRTDAALLCETRGKIKHLVALEQNGQYKLYELGTFEPRKPFTIAIYYSRPRTVESHWMKEPLTITHDSILVGVFESSAWIHYWHDGQFKSYTLSD